MPHARRVPVAVLAAALGAPGGLEADVAAVAAAYPPGAPGGPAADAAVGRLAAALGADEAGAARICLLVQACDATAALIGNALVAGFATGRQPAVDELLGWTVRHDPPVRTTRRVSTRSGEQVVLDLASADATFGAGPRPCPGKAHALALAAGFVEPVLARCAPAPGRPSYAPSPTPRIPARVEVDVA